jgi:hypothetical protein
MVSKQQRVGRVCLGSQAPAGQAGSCVAHLNNESGFSRQTEMNLNHRFKCVNDYIMPPRKNTADTLLVEVWMQRM